MQPSENAIGLLILYEVQDAAGAARDISTFTTTELVFEKPDGTVVVKDVDFQTDGTDGLLAYTTADGDLTPWGSFKVQAHIANASYDECCDVAIFHVNKVLNRG